MKPKTFKKDGFRKINCPGCARCLGELHLGEKKDRAIKCSNCKTAFIVKPPKRMTDKDGFKVIEFMSEGTVTADFEESDKVFDK